MGRSKSVTILLKEGQELPKDYDVTIQPISLENIFSPEKQVPFYYHFRLFHFPFLPLFPSHLIRTVKQIIVRVLTVDSGRALISLRS